MEYDPVDRAIEEWARERPDLDTRGLGIVSRVALLAKQLDRHDKRVLSQLELPPWAYEVIAALRRQGPPYQLSPTELRRLALLSSGAMTIRLDRLEERGLVVRSMSPDDRRSILITLTQEGIELADRAVAARLTGVQRLLGVLGEDEQENLSQLLRQLLVNLYQEAAA